MIKGTTQSEHPQYTDKSPVLAITALIVIYGTYARATSFGSNSQLTRQAQTKGYGTHHAAGEHAGNCPVSPRRHVVIAWRQARQDGQQVQRSRHPESCAAIIRNCYLHAAGAPFLLSPRRKPKHGHTSEIFQITETLSAVLDNAPLHPGTSASSLVQNRKYLFFQTGIGNDHMRSLQNPCGL